MPIQIYVALVGLLGFIGGVCLASLFYSIDRTEKRSLHRIIADLLRQSQLEREVHKNLVAAGLVNPEFEREMAVYGLDLPHAQYAEITNLEAFLADPRAPRAPR